jgi:cyclic beta-1,2-glucan synthetase
MTPSGNLELIKAEADGPRLVSKKPEPADSVLGLSAARLAANLSLMPGKKESCHFRDRCQKLSLALKPLLATLQSAPAKEGSDDFRVLHENIFLLTGELTETCGTFKEGIRTPLVHTADGTVLPRIAALADNYLTAAAYQFAEPGFTEYMLAFQEVTVLNMAELWALIPVLKLVLLEQVVESCRRLQQDPSGSYHLDRLARSLRDIKEADWKEVIEPLLLFDRTLREDPAQAYTHMDYESRDLYRQKIVHIAAHCDRTELEVASEAIALARETQKKDALREPSNNNDPRVTLRASHVGTYLLAEGTPLLERKVGYRAPFAERPMTFIRKHPDEFYLLGIAVVTLLIVFGIVILLTAPSTALGLVLLSMLAVLLPSSQSAVQIMNYLATRMLPAQILPKLDFSERLPNDCMTMVAIPTLLLDEKQVRRLVENLEVRYLGNHDPNLHFALVTDLPDSETKPQEDDALTKLCTDLIAGLNEKYAEGGKGSFFLFHRHRVYNPNEGFWMGWERKRGKLMDLNRLLRGEFDSFPHKVGDLSILPNVRFIITLDSDTELPRGSARRMVGTLAHPLNQAIIDPEKGIVTTGYGILQPRVGVSVQSSARSRLANIYSGQTGLDIYTHAASDVYQDLYGEGIFVGKGIYEVDTLHRVLERRFPHNALLSHDLIEGAYARAGLVSDVEVIEDYPSHYSAHYRRKHRWLRGDWQIAGWLLPLVPDESGRQVRNPLSIVSQWKILDNLRRALVEPALFALFLLSWLCLPGRPEDWTLATIGILFLPALFQLGVELIQAVAIWKRASVVDSLNGFLNASVADLLTITLLAHQALLAMDAMVRTMVRGLITRQRLLQWETAAQAELAGEKRTILDIYLSCTPALALGLFLLVWFLRPEGIFAALPILVLWACSKPISSWLNRPPRGARKPASEANQSFVRQAALRTWRYFDEFSTEEHHWLIPDNVREEPLTIAARISPTNLGFLLNARQVACEFGYITVPEFTQQTLRTFATLSGMERYRGHFINWYDTRSLAPLAPRFVSSVDSGNLMASLWTLQQGCLELLNQPLLQPELRDGFLDHIYGLTAIGTLPRRKFSAIKKAIDGQNWQTYLLDVPDDVLEDIHQSTSRSKHADARWFQEKAEERIRQVSRTVQQYCPWMRPEFGATLASLLAPLKSNADVDQQVGQGAALDDPALHDLPEFIDDLAVKIRAASDSTASAESNAVLRELLSLLPDARAHVVRLIENLKKLAVEASMLAEEMDFKFLVSRSRGLLSIGFDVETEQLHTACYDLLASEARIAFFVAIAKDDIPQESWFQLGRTHIMNNGTVGLLSWTGTMFEYLMPALWMRIYPNTLLERAATVAVRAQQEYAAEKGVPWGISESSAFAEDNAGNYQYHAFGVPELAIHKPDENGPVISPYSTFLALPIDSIGALRNLRKMQPRKSLAAYGFYESLDFTPSRSRSRLRRYEMVRCWMVHHQGMSLLAMANFLRDDVVQRWFHSHPRVQAAELLLQEKPVDHLRS